MDLELTDEQNWLSAAVDTLLTREWPAAEQAPDAGPEDRARLWAALVEFGALTVDPDEGLGAVELCLIARALGAHLGSTPFHGSTAARFAGVEGLGDDTLSVALLEPGRGWSADAVATTFRAGSLRGAKVAVEHGADVTRLAVVARADDAPALVLVDAAGVEAIPQPGLDPSVPMASVALDDVAGELAGGPDVVRRLSAVGALLAAAESVGAAGRLLEDARRYASERRQFGHAIGSYQALRHLLADLYVRHTSGWSTVLYAAAALDEDLDDAARTTAVAKAYVARGAREVAHGAMQVFGGIAFTEEHAAHRFLRRIVVRERQFGDATHHERELGRMLAARASASAERADTPAAVS